MKSKWRVSSQSNPDGEREFQVFRTLDVDKTDHSGNREYADGIFTLRSQAEALANMLNGENMPNGEGAL